ncbi:MAG TPA: hypothetical protein PLT00_13665 [Verrucomicrobiota bacterium]|nr:hypothetical protein [Verrucomicrobiota bacterium]OQB88420.1 MAG: hypothetical protein BWX84_03032 [Verrucomicrobia bacterium ADurb.Bin118]HPY31341.1 hypothetical protein [Verrucomicrobiota bacterium]HQB17746.1 hypothetical protein [Verrucomicrobiota bacterium]
MKNHHTLKFRCARGAKRLTTCLTALLLLLGLAPLRAATVTLYENDFEAYTEVATSLADEATDADPTGAEWIIQGDDPLGAAPGSGVQVINWLAHSGNQSLLLRSRSEIQLHLPDVRSGASYTLEYWMHVVREPTSDRNFYVILGGMGADNNGTDIVAFLVQRSAGSTAWMYYDGVGAGPGWKNVGANQAPETWQHHRFIIDPNALTFTLYIDDMDNAVISNADLARPDGGVPTRLVIRNEGNSADDGYFAVDDLLLTVENPIDLTTVFKEGFEDYPARVNPDDNANPLGPWVTTESVGAGGGKERAPSRVQVVDASVVTPHSGSKCLKLEGGHRAGVSIAWGVPPESDVQITWWARVPATAVGGEYNYLRMSLYGAEDGNCYAGDSALLGYGCRSAEVGDATSLTYYTTGWLVSGVDFLDNVWEEYRLTTHNSVGRYTIIKNPSGANPVVVVDRAPYIGTATVWGPTFLAAWSSSNGAGHPPVFIDDIEIKTLVSIPDPLPTPYNVQIEGDRFTNATVVPLSGPVGAVAVDPQDNKTFVFTIDATPNGSIRRATKVASGNWVVDPQPVVEGLSNPSGLTIGADGTLWWVHDYAQALMRLRAPWDKNTPERVIADFILPGATVPSGGAFADDDPFDVCFAPASFTGTLGQPNMLVVMDRGVDANENNALFLVDPNTTQLDQVNYDKYLFGPTTTELGAMDLVALTPLAQSGEVVTLCLDGQVTAVDANGTPRSFWPAFYQDPYVPIQPAAMAADPKTGRLWIADDLFGEVWSCDGTGAAEQKEISFPLTNPGRPEMKVDFHEPGMAFAPDGSFLVVSDGSVVNGGGRLIILHNEDIVVPDFTITSVVRSAAGVELQWQSGGGAKYDVLRGTDVADAASFTPIATDLEGTSYVDAEAPAGAAFYRVVAKP